VPIKPIYDIPRFPGSDSGRFEVDNLMEQAVKGPGFALGERAEVIEKQEEDGTFV
jgi:thioredoxin reductase (NADPH)